MTHIRRTAAVVAAGALFIGAAACNTDKLAGLNKNPNYPSTVDKNLLFTQAATAGPALTLGSSMQLYFTELFAQHVAEYQYPDDDAYNIRPATIDSYWQNYYSGPLEDLKQAYVQSAAIGDSARVASTLTMRAYLYQNVTDLWGDVPFSEANRGNEGIIKPAYDQQSQIYDSLLVELARAQHMAKGTGAGFGGADPIYGGNKTAWYKFAASLRARVAMRISTKNPTRAAAELTAVRDSGFSSNADNALIRWPGDGQNDSPYFTTFLTRDDHRMSVSLVDTLLSLNDPRLPIYAQPTQEWQDALDEGDTVGVTKYAGLQNALTADEAAELGYYTSRLGTKFYQRNTPSVLMDYAEYEFIMAEAVERGLIPAGGTTAAQYYYNGITASMQFHGVAAPAIAAYLAQARVVYTPGAAGLQQIGLQKWIALFGEGTEAWADQRRTGIPDLVVGPEAVTAIIPRRIEYPQSEQSLNLANYNAAVARQGANTKTTKIYWTP